MDGDERGLKHRALTDRIIGIFYEVYNELGPGFLESVYEAAMAKAMRDAGLAVLRQHPIQVWFRGEVVGEFRGDLLVEGIVLIELKAGKGLDSANEAQTLNYLKATSIELALLMNFGPQPSFKRFAFANDRKSRPS